MNPTNVPVPTCPKVPKTLEYHGDVREVPYYWLRERENPKVKEYLESENKYGESLLGKDHPQKLFEEMKARWKETDASIPTRDKSFYYLSRSVEGQEYKSYSRRPIASDVDFVQKCADLLKSDPDAVIPKADDEVVLLDMNKVSEEEKLKNVDLGTYEISPNEQKMATTVDLSDGREIFTILIRDLANGNSEIRRLKSTSDVKKIKASEEEEGAAAVQEDAAPKEEKTEDEEEEEEEEDPNAVRIGAEIAWGSDDVFYYFTMDAQLRPYRLWRHDLTKPEDEASTMIYEEKDQLFTVGGLTRTDDDSFVTFSTEAKTSGETYFVSTKTPSADWTCFHPRTAKFEYAIEHHSDLKLAGGGPHWMVFHNGGKSTNFQLDCVSSSGAVDVTDRKNWRNLVEYDPMTKLSGVTAYADFLLLPVRRDGFEGSLLAMNTPRSADAKPLKYSELINLAQALPTIEGAESEAVARVHTIEVSSTEDFTHRRFRVSVENPIIPTTTYEFEVPATAQGKEDLKVSFLRRAPVKGGYNPADYDVQLVFATAKQNSCDLNDPEVSFSALTGDPEVKIPITIWYKKDKFVKGENPMVLYAYGSYGLSMDPAFGSTRLSLLDRGFVYAIAAIRGGGEMGRIWRNSGRMQHKMNTFTDYIACAEYVREQKWCHPDKLMARGGSAGGLLMGAAMNLRPDLFRTVSALVPFVDVVTTMCDPSIPLTVQEWDEWGNPLEDAEVYKYMKSYSPMDNLPGNDVVMPNLFIESGFSDPRVAYFEPAAWGAALRDRWEASAKKDRVIVHKCNLEAGHGGSAGRYQFLHELSFEYSFLLKSIGME